MGRNWHAPRPQVEQREPEPQILIAAASPPTPPAPARAVPHVASKARHRPRSALASRASAARPGTQKRDGRSTSCRPWVRLSRANWHLVQKGVPRRALGRDTSALPLTRWRSSRWPTRRPRRYPIYNVKQPSFLPPGSFCARVLLPLFSPSSLPTPRVRGLAERPETSSLDTCRAVTRDATLARHEPSRATGRPAPRRSAVALSAQVPPPSPLPGPARRLPRHQAFLPGCGAGLFVSAVTGRGRRHIPLRLQDRF